MGWRVFGEGRGFEEEEMERELEKAYKEGCREGYEKAMREMEDRGSYGERRYDDGDWDDDGMGMRRGVKNTGRYGGEYRRRRR